MMDYPSSNFGDCSFSRFGSIMWTNRHTHTHTQMNALLPQILLV